jgi:hypothetical protein
MPNQQRKQSNRLCNRFFLLLKRLLPLFQTVALIVQIFQYICSRW